MESASEKRPVVFVTGGTGFLGSHFLREGLAAGLKIRALRRQGTSPRIPLPEEPEWVVGTLADDVSAALRGCDVLVHFAACGVSPQIATQEEMFQVNVMQSLRLWHRALDAGVRRIVLCGSCFEYGAAAARYERIPVDAPLMPVEPYGASKAAATMAALGLVAARPFELILLRPFHFYGEGQFEGNFWPALRKAALAGEDFKMTLGEQVRDFSPVESVARAFVAACRRSDPVAGVPVLENLGSGEACSMADFARAWWTHWHASGRLLTGALPYRAKEVMRFVPEVVR